MRLYRLRPQRPGIMGVLNVTPDSFWDGGWHAQRDAAVAHGLKMVEHGADIVDVGGESTRPGALEVSIQQELDRVIPVIESLRSVSEIAISVDTQKVEVMRAAVDAGANLINDVNALRAPGALELVAALGVPVCLMHMQGNPQTMQVAPRYHDVVGEVSAFLQERVETCIQAGIARSDILIDPGFGFGKRLEHNLALLARLEVFCNLGLPVLVGLSRKGMIGQLIQRPLSERLPGSLALALVAAERGASWVRVHDVEATHDALEVLAQVWASTSCDS